MEYLVVWNHRIGTPGFRMVFLSDVYVGLLTPLTIVISTINNLVGGLEHHFYGFPFSWEFHNPN